MKFATITICTLCLLWQNNFAQTVYVAPGGNDKNTGAKDQPLASLNGAKDRLLFIKKTSRGPAKKTEVLIAAGDYFMPETLNLSLVDAGTKEVPLVFKAEAGAMPVFYGGTRLQPFKKVSDSLWETDVPEVRSYGFKFEQLYVNGARATRAQTPDSIFYRPTAVNETIMVKGNGRSPERGVQQIKIPAAAAKWLEGLSEEDIKNTVITFYHHWDNTRKFIDYYNAADTSVYISGEGMKPWNPITTESLFVIENIRTALDAPGEWFLDQTGTLYYRPKPGETIENTSAIAPLLDKFITIAGDEKTGARVSNIRFENIAFRVAGYRMPPSGVEPAQAAAPIAAGIEIDFANNISFVNCELSSTGGSGIWFRRACAGGLIEHCYLHDLGAGAVKIGEPLLRADTAEVTNHIKVLNNIAVSGGNVFPCAVGMTIFNASDNELLHNEIADFKYSGVSVGWVWGYTPSPSKRNTVAYNNIHHLGWGVLSDMGGVYTLGASEGTVVNNNIIHHIYALDYGGWGLYTDEGSQGIVMENNLVYNCKSSGFHQHYGKDNIIRNNIFATNIKAQLQATRVEDHRSFSFTNNIIYYNSGTLLSSSWSKFNIVSDSNCYWDTRTTSIAFEDKNFKQWQQQGKDVHSVIADPGFVDAAHFDFRFKNNQLINKIAFKPFDYTQAGVYGDAAWIQKAVFNPLLAAAFDRMVAAHER